MSDSTKAALEKINALYNAATGSWTGVEWTHYICINGHDTETECDWANDECEECSQAKRAAELAEDSARIAMEALSEGNWDEAAHHAKEAAAEERWFGDTPHWGAWADAVVALAEAQASAEAAPVSQSQCEPHWLILRGWYVERDFLASCPERHNRYGERGYIRLMETTKGLVSNSSGDGGPDFVPKSPERLAWEAASLELEERRKAEGIIVRTDDGWEVLP